MSYFLPFSIITLLLIIVTSSLIYRWLKCVKVRLRRKVVLWHRADGFFIRVLHTLTHRHTQICIYTCKHTHTHTLWESDTVEHSNLIGQPASSGQLISFCLVSSIRVHLFSLLKQFDSNVIAAGYEHSNRFRSVVGIVHLPLSANWMNNTWMMLRHIASNRLQCLLRKYVAANQNCWQLPWRFKISGRCKRLTNQSHSTLIIDSND